MTQQRFIIERDVPAVGSLEREQLRLPTRCASSAPIFSGHRAVCDDKTYCVCLARDEAIVRKHAEMAGLPVTRIVQVGRIVDPTTERMD